MAKVLGTVTIGQSPRVDLIPEMQAVMGTDVQVIEAGALDGMTLDEVRAIAPGSGDQVLVTRMADGTAVKIAERHILSKMQDRIDGLAERGAQIIALVCTGEFPRFRCDRLLVRPQRVLYNAVSGLAEGLSLGVLIPDQDQVGPAEARWHGAAARVKAYAASPYGAVEEVRRGAAILREWGAQLIAMDCIGYTLAMKAMVREEIGVPVVLARSIVARTIAEVM